MAFTTDNTTGFTASELTALNVELNGILAWFDADDTDGRDVATKAFHDEVARR